MTCSSSLLDPDGSCYLWTLYNDEGKKIMCKDIRSECEAYMPSFLKPQEQTKIKPSLKYEIELGPDNINRIIKHECGVKYPVGQFYMICDLEANELSGIIARGQNQSQEDYENEIKKTFINVRKIAE